MRSRVLRRTFYLPDPREVAPLLLNKVLVHDDPVAGRLAGRIVEVEAYCGTADPGSHAYRGPTLRNATMFGPPGHLYVYFTYGMHWCANVVCCSDGTAGAVLLRALAPLQGVDAMWPRRPKARRPQDLCSGPARLAQALGIDRSADGADLVAGPVSVVDDGTPPPAVPGVSTRIGLSPGRGEDSPWRFYVPRDPNLSRPPR
ncbi:MAG: DNA-3-methyladenine glycosylase [Acidimicrobiia bacterium]